MTPLVSILIPAYNAAPWIAETLSSALGQTHPRCEIIVVDDGSRDETVQRTRAVADAHPDRIRVVSQTNAGASAARNHALRLARGEFIQYLDADDLLSSRKIELQLARLASAPAAALATCRWGRFESSPAEARFVDEEVFRDFAPEEWLLLHVAECRMMHPAAWLCPRTVLDAAGPWDESLSLNDDGEYFARVVLASSGMVFTADADAATYYRSGLGGSLSRRRSATALSSLYRSIEKISALVSAREDSPRTRAALATYWQRLAYELYPDDPAGSRRASGRARDFGGSDLRPPMGARLRWFSRIFGWRAAYRLARRLAS